MKAGAFRGATMYEAYIGRLWFTFLQRRFWRSSRFRLIRIEWDRSNDEG